MTAARCPVPEIPPGELHAGRLRRWLRPFLLGAASLLDPTGSVTYRAARKMLPPPDVQAIRGYFDEAGRLIADAMREESGRGR
jgi:hypothetical protein